MSSKLRWACRLTGIGLPLSAVLASLWAYELGWAWQSEGGIAKLCHDILDFNYDNGGGVYLAVPFIRGYWVESCKTIFGGLKGEQRKLLEALLDKPLRTDVLWPQMQLAKSGNAKKVVPDSVRNELRQKINETVPRKNAQKGPSAENLTKQVLAHSGGIDCDWMRMHASFETLGPPAQEPIVPASEVGKHLKEGRLVRFDATKILPAKTFNITLDKLSSLHGPEGDDITILAFLHESKNCRMQAYANRKTNPVGAMLCPNPPTLGETRKMFPMPIMMPRASRIALKRLPMYINEDQMLKDLGLQGVERPEGQIIMGHAMGDTHWDEQDNIFIQASGVAVVFGVPAEYADALGGDEGWSAKSTGKNWDDWIKGDPLRSSVPWYYMVLKPGDGIAIPSRAFHAVYGSHNRASLQTFLEPKYKGMVFETNKHSYWQKETDTRQALRNLYFKTLGNLWDTRQLGFVAQGAIIEYL